MRSAREQWPGGEMRRGGASWESVCGIKPGRTAFARLYEYGFALIAQREEISDESNLFGSSCRELCTAFGSCSAAAAGVDDYDYGDPDAGDADDDYEYNRTDDPFRHEGAEEGSQAGGQGCE